MRTWRFPRRSALTMLFNASFWLIEINIISRLRASEECIRGQIREPCCVADFALDFNEEGTRKGPY